MQVVGHDALPLRLLVFARDLPADLLGPQADVVGAVQLHQHLDDGLRNQQQGEIGPDLFRHAFSRLTNGCALECGVGFRQLRTCRRTGPGQRCAKKPTSSDHLVGAGE